MARSNAIRRMDRHRNFPEGTCPWSRHAAFIAENLIKGNANVIDPDEYPQAGESIACAIGSLWQARNKLMRLGFRYKNGRWVKVKGQPNDRQNTVGRHFGLSSQDQGQQRSRQGLQVRCAPPADV